MSSHSAPACTCERSGEDIWCPDHGANRTIAELREELELAAEQGRLVGLDAERYRQALETLMEFGKRLMGAETMEERGIGACICESARVIEHG